MILFDTFTLTPLHFQLAEEKLHIYIYIYIYRKWFKDTLQTNPVIRYLCQDSYLLQSLSCLTRSQEIIHDQHTIRWSKELRGHVEVSEGRLPCQVRVVCIPRIPTEDPRNPWHHMQHMYKYHVYLISISTFYIWYMQMCIYLGIPYATETYLVIRWQRSPWPEHSKSFDPSWWAERLYLETSILFQKIPIDT